MSAIYPYLDQAVRVVVILLLAWIGSRVVQRLIRGLRVTIIKIMESHAGGTNEALEKRAETIGGMLRKTAAVLIWTVAIIMALQEVGFDIRPLLAGAGVAGLAIGFGAQSLVKDVISGVFMLMENQFRINDVVLMNGVGGLVEEINLRTTVLRGLDGTVHIFPNGAIQQVSNMTRGFSYYVFDMGVAYKEDTDKVAAVMKEVAHELWKDPEYAPLILEPLEILGVDQFAASSVVVKARIKTKPIKQWQVGRELNRRFKKKFDELGIEIPFPHMSVYFGEASKPFQLQLNEGARAEVEEIVRQVLADEAASKEKA